MQWRNRQGGQRLLTGKFLLTYREKRGKEKREKGWILRKKRRKIVKGKVENWKRKVEKLQNEERTFFFLFFFASHFSKPLKLVLGLQKWKFSTRKKHFMPGIKSGKMTLPPQKNFPVTPPSAGRHLEHPLHMEGADLLPVIFISLYLYRTLRGST